MPRIEQLHRFRNDATLTIQLETDSPPHRLTYHYEDSAGTVRVSEQSAELLLPQAYGDWANEWFTYHLPVLTHAETVQVGLDLFLTGNRLAISLPQQLSKDDLFSLPDGVICLKTETEEIHLVREGCLADFIPVADIIAALPTLANHYPKLITLIKALDVMTSYWQMPLELLYPLAHEQMDEEVLGFLLLLMWGVPLSSYLFTAKD